MRVLVSGASGYIGRRLVPRLLEAGHRVRCLSRDPERLAAQTWSDRVEAVAGDVQRPDSLTGVFDDLQAAYYLIHSLDAGGGFVHRDRVAAGHFRDAAAEAGIPHIIYLGGLGDEDRSLDLSEHLWSRQDVGRVLAAAPGVAVTELRAAVIIGAGSVSFELLRHAVRTQPFIPTGGWARTRCQPVAVDDVLDVLTAVPETVPASHRVIEVAGSRIVTYAELMGTFASAAGLTRPRLPVAPPPAAVTAAAFAPCTPVATPLARALIDSLDNEVVARLDSPVDHLPTHPLSLEEALRRALAGGDGHAPTTAATPLPGEITAT